MGHANSALWGRWPQEEPDHALAHALAHLGGSKRKKVTLAFAHLCAHQHNLVVGCAVPQVVVAEGCVQCDDCLDGKKVPVAYGQLLLQSQLGEQISMCARGLTACRGGQH